MNADKSKKPTDVRRAYADSMTTKHLMEQLTTSHLQGALRPTEKPKPLPTPGSCDKGSEPTNTPKQK
jgi:hypothetical protein